MIRVTIWNENMHERGLLFPLDSEKNKRLIAEADMRAVLSVHPNGIHGTLRDIFEAEPDMVVRIATIDMPECGLSQKVIDDTDVLVWWAHIDHTAVPDDIMDRVVKAVHAGMGFIALHSALSSKPMLRLLGSSGYLQWRENDRARVWCCCPTHQIAQGIPSSFELPEEEMYGEPSDLPRPDDVIFINWYAGGEVFRSGCTWTRGFGKIFYFQAGHEVQRSYFVPEVRQLLKNAVRWAYPSFRMKSLKHPNALESAEDHYRASILKK